MNNRLISLSIPLSLISLSLQASCLSGDEINAHSDAALFFQSAYAKRAPSLWKISGENAYATDNVYSDAGIKLSSHCTVIENKLDLDFTLYGLAEYASQTPGRFEKDKRRSRALINQLRMTYTVSDNLRLEGGKLQPKAGNFFLKSPSALLNNYYAGFKTNRLYDPTLRPLYMESSWGVRLVKESRDYTLSLTVVPQLASIRQRYESSSNWSANQRANADERYHLSYTDYRLADHTPSINLLLGDSGSVSFADSFNYTPQFMINAGLALHRAQQWRHFSPERAAEVQHYTFPASLYDTQNKNGIELAIGGQYTTDNFNVFGMEYYFQSEGYSRIQWKQQADFVRYLNTNSPYDVLNQAFDSYKYLIGAEISNVGNRGGLQGKHYINTWAAFHGENNITLQPYLVFNVMDYSSLFGVHYSTPLEDISEHLEFYTGAWGALGKQDAEFSLFGKMAGVYIGIKYFL
ncbi:hypothetical protein Q5705_08740 [Kosakonia sp. H02]|nr:hypothetical protein Q5705_08740 [Kosakonia sp. H02]